MSDLVAHLTVLQALSPVILASSHSGSGSGGLALLLAGPAGGTALYAGVYRYYRNADKRHGFESETSIALKHEITGHDEKVDEVKGTRDSRIDGDNARDFRSRVAKLE